MLTNPRDAVRGQSGLQKIVSSHMLGILSYSLSLRRAVFFRYWTSNVVTLKSGQRSFKVIESGTIRWMGTISY